MSTSRCCVAFAQQHPLRLWAAILLTCDLLRDAFGLAVVYVHRAVASIIGGLIGASALPEFKTAYCVPGSCLRMPHPAGRTRSS